jgi:hypothetical protein
MKTQTILQAIDALSAVYTALDDKDTPNYLYVHKDNLFRAIMALRDELTIEFPEVTLVDDQVKRAGATRAMLDEYQGWVEWQGSDKAPQDLNPDTLVEIKFRTGEKFEGPVRGWNWEHNDEEDDIVCYRVVENGWTECQWQGSEECPVGPNETVEVMFGDGVTEKSAALSFRWTWINDGLSGDIVRYRVVNP